MKITIMSQEEAKKLIAGGFPENTAVISLFDPPEKDKRYDEDELPPDYSRVCERCFKVAIHDIDIEILNEYGLSFDTYFQEAPELARFIKQAAADGMDFICQCHYGQSRSAACAAAIKEYFDHSGIDIFADYRYYPNQLIFNKLLDALKNTYIKEDREEKKMAIRIVFKAPHEEGKVMEVSGMTEINKLLGNVDDTGNPLDHTGSDIRGGVLPNVDVYMNAHAREDLRRFELNFFGPDGWTMFFGPLVFAGYSNQDFTNCGAVSLTDEQVKEVFDFICG